MYAGSHSRLFFFSIRMIRAKEYVVATHRPPIGYSTEVSLGICSSSLSPFVLRPKSFPALPILSGRNVR